MTTTTATTEPSAVLTIAEMQHLVVALAPEFRPEIEVIAHQESWPTHPECYAYYVSRRSICASHIHHHLSLQPGFDGNARDVIVIVRDLSLEQFVHELAHAVEKKGDPTPMATKTKADIDLSMAIAKKCFEWQAPFEPSVIDPDHNAVFLRNVCHLWARAENLGLHVNPNLLDASGDGRYGWHSHIYDFYMTLYGETQTMLNSTFSKIMAKPQPPAFVELVLQNLFKL